MDHLSASTLSLTTIFSTFQAYTIENNAWVNESIAVQAQDDTYTGPIIWDFENWDVIHDYDEFYKENPGEEGTNATGPYMPIWMSSPVIPTYPVYNW